MSCCSRPSGCQARTPLHHVLCPLPGACVGAPLHSNPIRKTPPTIKYGHQVNCSDKQRKESGPYQSKEEQSVTIARVSAHPNHCHKPIVNLGPQHQLLAHRHVLSHLHCCHRIVEQSTRVHYHLS
jgi:hypothetical protein